MDIRLLVEALVAWFARSARDLPWRRTSAPYAIWVAEVMLQQTQVKTVLPYWERWMAELPDLVSLASCPPQKLHKLWEGLGYYTRVRNMQKAAQAILDKHRGTFPAKFEDILELPGIGRYTAGALSSIAFHQPRPILDGNVIRVLARLFGIHGDTRAPAVNAGLWDLAEELVGEAARRPPVRGVPAKTFNHAHPVSALNQALMELGALICLARQPRCGVCPVARHCVALRENRVDQLPERRPRPRSTERFFAAFVLRRKGRLLVRQRPPGVVNAHLWEFPNVELAGKTSNPVHAARQLLGSGPGMRLRPLCRVKHSITRYRITLFAYQVGSAAALKTRLAAARWLPAHQLRRLPFTSAHKRVLGAALATPGSPRRTPR